MTKFYTREQGNEGIKIPLTNLDGTSSNEYLIIRSIDSDEFRYAETDSKRDVYKASMIDDVEERKKMAKVAGLRLQIALVKGWSFTEEFNNENVEAFLTGAPHIADAIDLIATKRGMFLTKKPKSSGRSQDSKKKVKKSRKVPASATKTMKSN